MEYIKSIIYLILMPIYLTTSGFVFKKYLIYPTVITVICVLLVAYLYNCYVGKLRFKDFIIPTTIIEFIALLYFTAFCVALVSSSR